MLEALQEGIHLLLSFDQEIYEIFWLTLFVTISSTGIATIIGVPLGVLFGVKRFPFRESVLKIVYTMMALPPVLAGLITLMILSRQGLLGSLGLLFTPAAMIIAQVILILPIIIGTVSRQYEQGGQLLLHQLTLMEAPRHWRLRLLLKEDYHGIISAIMLGFNRAISEVGAVMIVGGNIKGQTRTMTTFIAMNKSMGAYSTSLAMGLLLLLLAFLVQTLLRRNEGGKR